MIACICHCTYNKKLLIKINGIQGILKAILGFQLLSMMSFTYVLCHNNTQLLVHCYSYPTRLYINKVIMYCLLI